MRGIMTASKRIRESRMRKERVVNHSLREATRLHESEWKNATRQEIMDAGCEEYKSVWYPSDRDWMEDDYTPWIALDARDNKYLAYKNAFDNEPKRCDSLEDAMQALGGGTASEPSDDTGFRYLRRFTKNDWYGWAGAEDLPSGSEPYIWDDDKCTIIVAGDIDDRGRCIIDLYPDDEISDVPASSDKFYSTNGLPEASALSIAEKMCTDLSHGSTIQQVISKYGLYEM